MKRLLVVPVFPCWSAGVQVPPSVPPSNVPRGKQQVIAQVLRSLLPMLKASIEVLALSLGQASSWLFWGK